MAKTIVENPCPRCGRPGAKSGEKIFFCGDCQMEFEPGDDGPIGRGRPDVIAERREEFQLRERARKRKRNYGR